MTTRALWEFVREDFGLDVVELTRVHGGADQAAEVWLARAGERRYAVKWSGGGTDAGARVSAELAAAGVAGVAGPVPTRGGELWSVREGRRLTVMPWVDGRGAAEVGLTDAEWTAYGVLLAGVHSAEPSEGLRRVLPALNPVSARMPGLFRELDERLTGQVPGDEIEAELARLWREHRELILGLLEPVDGPRGTPVICHGDPHLGNVIVGESVHLIDWDDAVLAAREQDLMFVLGGMGTLGPANPGQLDAFFTGYGETEIDDRNLRYYRHARALEDVALWAEQAITGPDREDSLRILRGVLGPDGLAVLAVS
ncbi:phosphotransferase enzyme family protein [Kribbella sp. ALI-6-A]|uniref:phosphotransferase enzyme family protein n=1 Tax=Kribbella sp. ALI-6-A TaxID=1933817 RepID=UPI00143DE171|nr:phosphotransferase [Kribbella sp. ALI-6-A]